MNDRCLIVDVETTGTDPKKDRIVEFGMVFYSITNQTTLYEAAWLSPVKDDENPAEHINRITPHALSEMRELREALPLTLNWEDAFRKVSRHSDYLVAHNAAFDSKFLPDVGRPWLCTMEDFLWPKASGRGLVGIALAHGVGVSSVHRALTDCRLIAELFNRMTGLPEMFRVACRPKVRVRGLANYEKNDLMYQHGFRFNREEPKGWFRNMARADVAALPFPHHIITPLTADPAADDLPF